MTTAGNYESAIAAKWDHGAFPIHENAICLESGNVSESGASGNRPTLHRSVILKSGNDIEPASMSWLWQNWLVRGKLHLLAGEPGLGKSTMAMSLAATTSVGGRWPDGTLSEPGNVLIWSGEDDIADTLLPRLIASGADRARCRRPPVFSSTGLWSPGVNLTVFE
jgi:putative DNA primase/helicase